MTVAVTDANIFIHLIKMNLLDRLFLLPFKIHTTDHVLNELKADQQLLMDEFVASGQIKVASFDHGHIQEIQALDVSKGLSFVDRGLFYISLQQTKDTVLLTGDNLLRKTSRQRGLNVHGILWLLDTFLEQQVASKVELLHGLEILTLGFHRLPAAECNKRLEDWKRN